MTMFSFRVEEAEAEEATRWAQRLGMDRSELLREALHQYLVRLRAEDDVEAWLKMPMTGDEQSLAEISDWGPAEDWTDWLDATG
ncbi:MAG TPA: CopG family transcriptional regulator [Acidimicrobiia bacterium]|nr:CopG family transcriptional regulator [Acidimicrobiia bacterium]